MEVVETMAVVEIKHLSYGFRNGMNEGTARRQMLKLEENGFLGMM